MSISVVINTKNAAQTLERTLESVAFADEVIVADMESTDNTMQIAKKHAATIISVADTGFVEPARNQAIASASNAWVLIIDADEVIPPSLRRELKKIASSSAAADSYYLPRKNIIFDKWIRHSGWWPDYLLRFFKKGCVEWNNAIHSVPKVTGRPEYLEAHEELAIEHYNYQTVEQYIDKLNRYTTIEAKTRKESQLLNPLVAFRKEFLSRFFAREGIKDGTHGLALALLQSFYEVAVSLKHWQSAGFPLQKQHSLDDLEKLHRELHYWICLEHMNRSSGFYKLWWKVRQVTGV
jgi:glycosyltransferase involved in cell wall biosynthesis